MKQSLRLSSQLVVQTNHQPPRRGVLGALVIDSASNQLLSLLPGQLVAGADILEARLGSETIQVSLEVPTVPTAASARVRCATLVVAVPLRKLPIVPSLYQDIAAGLPAAAKRIAPKVEDNPWAILGQRVHVVTGRGRGASAILSSANSRFVMPEPTTGERTTYYDALELRAENGRELVGRGDAGALVVTDKGHWVGLVVAGGGSTAFAAPMHEVLAADGFELIKEDRIRKHNRRISHPYCPLQLHAHPSLKPWRINSDWTTASGEDLLQEMQLLWADRHDDPAQREDA